MWPDRLRLLEGRQPSVPEDLAVDESLLRAVDADPDAACLRLWEAGSVAVIVGRSNVLAREVHVAACQADGVPILRRCSGGGAVVIGPGCLCYSLVLPIDERHRQWGIPNTTAAILQRIADGLRTIGVAADVAGISDLVHFERKFSGNAQRWNRRAILHHGTLLYDFDASRIEQYLAYPSQTPTYRAGRNHAAFVAPLRISREELVSTLRTAWHAEPSAWTATDLQHVPQLLAERYHNPAWHAQL